MKRSAFRCLLLLCLFCPVALKAQTATAPSPSDKGTAIGTTVRAALGAAFPGATTLVDTIINAAAARIRLREAEKQAAKEAAKQPAEQSRNNAVNAASEELRKLDNLAIQLDVVTTFADVSSAANQQVLLLNSTLSDWAAERGRCATWA